MINVIRVSLFFQIAKQTNTIYLNLCKNLPLSVVTLLRGICLMFTAARPLQDTYWSEVWVGNAVLELWQSVQQYTHLIASPVLLSTMSYQWGFQHTSPDGRSPGHITAMWRHTADQCSICNIGDIMHTVIQCVGTVAASTWLICQTEINIANSLELNVKLKSIANRLTNNFNSYLVW